MLAERLEQYSGCTNTKLRTVTYGISYFDAGLGLCVVYTIEDIVPQAYRQRATTSQNLFSLLNVKFDLSVTVS